MLKTKKRKGLYAEASGAKRKVKYLTAYYLQGGKWRKVKLVKGI